MKIFIIPVEKRFQPSSQPFRYPGHNDDFGVEQDFCKFLHENKKLITGNYQKADFHYLSIYWTRWHLNHDFGQTGRDELQKYVNQIIQDDQKTFTVCQYADGPIVNLGKTIVFLSSRKGDEGIDIPLLCSAHQLPSKKPSKKYLASFIGSLKKHPIRTEMAEYFKGMDKIYIYGGNKGRSFFVQKTLESYITLCPRGYGGSSFRFFEAMQLGVVPLLISSEDIRPFKRFLKWNEYSFFAKTMQEAETIVYGEPKAKLLSMGSKCATLWKKELTYGKWCKYVIKELEDLNTGNKT